MDTNLMGFSHYFHGPKKSTRLEEVHQSLIEYILNWANVWALLSIMV